jgi:hypothetical protein
MGKKYVPPEGTRHILLPKKILLKEILTKVKCEIM